MIWLIRIPLIIIVYFLSWLIKDYAFCNGAGLRNWQERRALRSLMKEGLLDDIPEEKEN